MEERPAFKVWPRDRLPLTPEAYGPDFFDQHCFRCNGRLWQYDVNYSNDAGFDLFSSWGMKDGYGLFCDECFEKLKEKATLRWG